MVTMDGRGRRRGAEMASSVVLALALVLAPSTGLATAPPTDGPTAPELFREGQSRADAADYTGAIEKYEQAIALLPDDEANEGTRNRLRVELIRSQRKAFEIDDDPTHLTKAKVLIGDYRATLDAGASESRDWADGQLQEIEAALADYDARHPAVAGPGPEPETDADAAQPEGPRLEITPSGASNDIPPDPRAGRNLLVAGGVLAGLGVGSVILMAAGLGKANKAVSTFETDPSKRDRARADNQLGNTLGVAGGVAAGVFLTAGAVLMAIGVKKRNGTSRTALAPVIDGKQFGAVLRARF